ncbi:MAG TPA: outer membrane beta-barrel protein [Gemmatimonadaceae bacterium]|nr:outer membrane beta-barrel protein [Gemmatimonadaceae bacterium]
MQSVLVRAGVAAVAGVVVGIVSASAAAAQVRSRDRGFELGVDAEVSYQTVHRDGVTSQPDGTTSFNVPTGTVRIAFPTSGPVAFEIAGNFMHASAGGGSVTTSQVELGLPIALTDTRTSADWFVRPAIGLQYSRSGNLSFSRVTLGGGIGLRVPVSNVVSMRYELRDTYLTPSSHVSGNVIGLLAGVSVFTH